METLISGKGIISENASNTHIINELNLPIVVAGICSIVVIASPDGKPKTRKSGDVIYIPTGMKHEARAITALEFIEIQMGSE